MEQLRRALAAGWADQVARRIRSIDYLRAQEQQVGRGESGHRAGFCNHACCPYAACHLLPCSCAWPAQPPCVATPLHPSAPAPPAGSNPPRPALPHPPQGKRSRAVRYAAAAGLDEDVFLHPNSALHSTAPEFVVYTELIRTAKRPYMAGALGGLVPQAGWGALGGWQGDSGKWGGSAACALGAQAAASGAWLACWRGQRRAAAQPTTPHAAAQPTTPHAAAQPTTPHRGLPPALTAQA